MYCLNKIVCRIRFWSNRSTISSSDPIMTSGRSFQDVLLQNLRRQSYLSNSPQWKLHMWNSMTIALFSITSLLYSRSSIKKHYIQRILYTYAFILMVILILVGHILSVLFFWISIQYQIEFIWLGALIFVVRVNWLDMHKISIFYFSFSLDW